jgi:hypothetical protein
LSKPNPAAAGSNLSLQSKRGVRQAPDAALIEVNLVIPYSGGPPNRTVTSFEQVWVPASHTLYV